jgi:hypothetical protein
MDICAISEIRPSMRLQEIGIILAAAALWAPGLWGASFLSDDFIQVADWGMSSVGPWFSAEYVGFYRPLTALLFRVNYLLWGTDPLGYYLTDLLLHAGCALALWQLAGLLFPGPNRTGLWAALLFLFLPSQVFGVLCVAARTGTLCALFYLSSIALYLRGRSGGAGWELLSLFSFLLALMAKELAISLPFLILAWEGVLSGFRLRQWLRVCLPYFALLAGYVLFRYLLFGHLPYSPLHTNMHPLRLVTNAGIYTAKIFAPWGLEGLKPFFRAHPTGLWLAAILGLVAAGMLCWRCRRAVRTPQALSLIWIGVAMLPVLRLYSPWNTYLPAAGAALLIAGLVNGLESRRIRLGAFAVLLGVSAVYLLQQQHHWRQAGRLCQQVVEEVIRAAAERPGRIYLANLPAEWGEAPLFAGDWGLHGALRLKGHAVDVGVLANVYKTAPEERIETLALDGQRFALKLESPEEFFRLETMEVMSKRLRAEVGYGYTKEGARLTVKELNAQGEPNALEIDMGNPERLRQVMVWNGSRLVPLVQ